MVSFIGRLVAPALILLTFSTREARAWSRDGHRIVCRIAWQLLDQARRAEIERLTTSYRDPDGQPLVSYFDACAYADDARAKANTTAAWKRFAIFETWHYANVPRTTTAFPSPPCQVACVITAVPAFADSLRRATSDQSRTEALLFLSHFVGDLHQPLHFGFADDLGGNNAGPIEGGFFNTRNMHSLWDSGMLAKMIPEGGWQAFADGLAGEISPAQRASWPAGSTADWGQESYNIATSTKYQYCDWQDTGGAATCASRPGSRTLGPEYLAEFGDDVAQRLQMAGVRLAELIRTNLPLP